MSLESGKRIYELFLQVLHDPNYAEVATNFRTSFERIQNLSQNFSQEQWDALNDYLDALSKVYDTIMTIALEGRT